MLVKNLKKCNVFSCIFKYEPHIKYKVVAQVTAIPPIVYLRSRSHDYEQVSVSTLETHIWKEWEMKNWHRSDAQTMEGKMGEEDREREARIVLRKILKDER